MRLALPRPSGMAPTTSSVVVSMMETESDFVLVTRRVAAPAGPAVRAAVQAATTIGAIRDVTPDSSSRDPVDCRHQHVGRRPAHGKSYRVSDLESVVNLGRGGAEAHGHGRHVAGNLLVAQDHQVDVGQDGAHDAPDPPLALAAGRRGPGLRQLAFEPLRPPSPPEVAPADAQGQGQVDEEHDLPESHQGTCSSAAGVAAFSWLSSWMSASKRLSSRTGAVSGAHRART